VAGDTGTTGTTGGIGRAWISSAPANAGANENGDTGALGLL
jgi:hypothetical protein